MVLQPHKALWDGDEGRAQQRLGIQNACPLARNFAGAGFPIVIHDVLSDETARLYETALAEPAPRIVLLLPTFEEIVRRNLPRGARLTDDALAMLYEQQRRLTRYAEKVDNTDRSAEAVAMRSVGMMRLVL